MSVYGFSDVWDKDGCDMGLLLSSLIREVVYNEEARGVRAGVALEVSGLWSPVEESAGEDKPAI